MKFAEPARGKSLRRTVAVEKSLPLPKLPPLKQSEPPAAAAGGRTGGAAPATGHRPLTDLEEATIQRISDLQPDPAECQALPEKKSCFLRSCFAVYGDAMTSIVRDLSLENHQHATLASLIWKRQAQLFKAVCQAYDDSVVSADQLAAGLRSELADMRYNYLAAVEGAEALLLSQAAAAEVSEREKQALQGGIDEDRLRGARPLHYPGEPPPEAGRPREPGAEAQGSPLHGQVDGFKKQIRDLDTRLTAARTVIAKAHELLGGADRTDLSDLEHCALPERDTADKAVPAALWPTRVASTQTEAAGGSTGAPEPAPGGAGTPDLLPVPSSRKMHKSNSILLTATKIARKNSRLGPSSPAARRLSSAVAHAAGAAGKRASFSATVEEPPAPLAAGYEQLLLPANPALPSATTPRTPRRKASISARPPPWPGLPSRCAKAAPGLDTACLHARKQPAEKELAGTQVAAVVPDAFKVHFSDVRAAGKVELRSLGSWLLPLLEHVIQDRVTLEEACDQRGAPLPPDSTHCSDFVRQVLWDKSGDRHAAQVRLAELLTACHHHRNDHPRVRLVVDLLHLDAGALGLDCARACFLYTRGLTRAPPDKILGLDTPVLKAAAVHTATDCFPGKFFKPLLAHFSGALGEFEGLPVDACALLLGASWDVVVTQPLVKGLHTAATVFASQRNLLVLPRAEYLQLASAVLASAPPVRVLDRLFQAPGAAISLEMAVDSILSLAADTPNLSGIKALAGTVDALEVRNWALNEQIAEETVHL
ncbi:hypothetical protein DIPPA_17716 [Diplonema papillatum]|nr:hypothetical protein DIPPA_17716 [Diplonema papillatum]